MNKHVSSLGVTTIAAIAAVVLSTAGSTTSAQERIAKSPWLLSTVSSHQGLLKISYKSRRLVRARQLYNYNGDDSLNRDPFESGPDPDFCISCAFPEGSPTYFGDGTG